MLFSIALGLVPKFIGIIFVSRVIPRHKRVCVPFHFLFSFLSRFHHPARSGEVENLSTAYVAGSHGHEPFAYVLTSTLALFAPKLDDLFP